jgi:hypothetical protein
VTFGLVVAVSAAAGSEPSVSAALLKPEQVGPGYTKLTNSSLSPGLSTSGCGGHPIKSATLEVAYSAELYEDTKDSSEPLLVNEVIRFRSGGSATVFQQLRAAIFHCPQPSLLGPGAHGGKLHVGAAAVPGLTSTNFAVHVWQAFSSTRETLTIYAVVEQHGDELSLISGIGKQAETARAVVFHAARATASNLG